MRTRVFDIVSELATRRPWSVVIVAALLAVGGGLLAWNRLRLDANTDNLIGRDRPFMQRYERFLDEFGDLEFIYVVIDTAGDPQRAERAALRIVELASVGDDLRAVHGVIDPDEQLQVATRAMSDGELRELALAAEGARTLAASGHASIAAVARQAGDLVRRATIAPPGGEVPPGQLGRNAPPPLGDELLDDPRATAAASGVLLLKALVAGNDERTAAELGPLLSRGQKPVFLRSDTGRYLFVQILPHKDFTTLEVIESPLRRLRAAMDQVRAEEPGVDMGLTGKPVLQADELVTSNRDMVRGAALALVLCAAMLMVSTHSVVRPLLAVVAFLFAFGWTYGFATLAIGRINLLSNVFMLVLVAAGLDYGVHVLARYSEERRGAPSMRVERVVASATRHSLRGNLTGALTSCAVFLTALATDFQGLKELGIIASGGLLLCVLAMAFVLAALLTIVERHGSHRVPPIAKPGHFGLPSHRPVLVLAVLAAVTALLGWGLPRVNFEENLLNLQNPELDSVRWEKRLAEESSGNSWFGAVVVDRIEDVPAVLERAADRPSIGVARSVLDVVRPPTAPREAMRGRLSGGPVPPPGAPTQGVAPPSSDPVALAAALSDVLPPLRLLAGGAAARSPEEGRQVGSLVSAVQRTIAQLRGPDGAAVAGRIEGALQEAATSMATILEGDGLPWRDALPAAARPTSMSPSGRFLVMLHPREDVWDAAKMEVFVDDLRAVDPEATGVPFTHFESLRDMRGAFLRMSMLSVILVALVVLLDFRRPIDVVLAMLPLLLAMLWTFELLGLLGVSLNLANFFAIPILIGLGVDSAVHLLHRYHEGGEDRLDPGSTRRAVIVTNLTTTIGFAPLCFADHHGMRSLGLVMLVGNTACLAAVLLVLPATLAVRERIRAARGGRTE